MDGVGGSVTWTLCDGKHGNDDECIELVGSDDIGVCGSEVCCVLENEYEDFELEHL